MSASHFVDFPRDSQGKSLRNTGKNKEEKVGWETNPR
uniref:Uncharacterized protein n=1 Tax=Nelumbo nucifera TaxID=4432 RepID=A0A822ZD09_NELNU|nr:TPA_asm: hypothetical protein HUJ06_002324 [Nelumbo nucifera]